MGHHSYLTSVKLATDLPVLRKDFIIDPIQIYESRIIGADCILLITACLNDNELQDYYKISKSLQSEQNKFNIDLCGGDTTFSNKLSFTITSMGYSNKIIYRNKAKSNDDIYVTGNLGDSYLGLKALSNKVKIKNKDKLFFVDKYYKPELPLNLTKYLLKFANSSIDISDGLIDDLSKMINRQSLSFHLFENKIPISNKLRNFIKKQRLNKINLTSNGDDYQVLFTADIKKARIIRNASKATGIKITKIGKIVSGKDRSLILDEKGKQIRAKYKGYIHRF